MKVAFYVIAALIPLLAGCNADAVVPSSRPAEAPVSSDHAIFDMCMAQKTGNKYICTCFDRAFRQNLSDDTYVIVNKIATYWKQPRYFETEDLPLEFKELSQNQKNLFKINMKNALRTIENTCVNLK